MNRTARLPIRCPLLSLALVSLESGPASAQTVSAQTVSAQTASVPTASAPVKGSVTVPREKISLECTDSFYKTARTNFILQDEVYPSCTLIVPLALTQRWPGKRTFYIIPRVSANLYARDDRGPADHSTGRWLPLSPLVTPGDDALHTTLDSASYRAVELVGHFGKLTDVAGIRVPDTVGAGGKITVCAAPVRSGEAPCVTFDVTARFRVYRR